MICLGIGKQWRVKYENEKYKREKQKIDFRIRIKDKYKNNEYKDEVNRNNE